MKKKHLLLTAAAGIIYLTVSSFSGGTFGSQGNLTGGAGSANTCANCHTGGPGKTSGNIEVRLKSAGMTSMPVDKYEPGKDYLVTLNGSHQALTNFGFQLLAANSSNSLVGSFSNAPSGTQLSGSNQVIEHSGAITEGGATSFSITVDWTAPAMGTGNVTFSGIVNAVDALGSNGNDDPGNNISKVLSEQPASVATVKNVTVFKAYPNPVTNSLTLDLSQAAIGTYSIQVYNNVGQVVDRQELIIKPNGYTTKLNTRDWIPGLHFIQIMHEGDKRTLTVLKQ